LTRLEISQVKVTESCPDQVDCPMTYGIYHMPDQAVSALRDGEPDDAFFPRPIYQGGLGTPAETVLKRDALS
jgi:hypothetical protein